MTLKRLDFRTFFRTGTLSAATLVLALGAFGAHAKDDGKRDKHVDRMVSRMEKELDLSKDQSAKIREILSRDTAKLPHPGMGMGFGKGKKDKKGCADCAHCGAMAHGHGFGRGENGFLSQLRASSVDTAAMNRDFAARSDSMQARLRAGHARRVATFAEIHAVLTPAQRAKAADKLEKHAAEREKKWKEKCEKKGDKK